ncbi:MAG TPA: hypothetical protein VES42_21910 [Pilimelia sp.]|nr:hypothetical protein [Pilimelia sp.]
MREELGEGLEHLAQAASHAAGGVSSTVGPAAGKLRNTASAGLGTTVATLAPLAVAAKDTARKAKVTNLRAVRRSEAAAVSASSRWPRLATLLAAGAAVGAVSALVLRRRRQQQQWDEYDPGAGADPALSSAADSTPSPIESLGDALTPVDSPAKGTTGATTPAVTTPGTLGSTGAAATGLTTPVPGTGLGDPGSTPASSADELISGAATRSNNSRG